MQVACAAEVPVFYFMNKIIGFLGTLGTLNVVLFATSFRLLCYPLILWSGSTWRVLFVEPLNCITFACAWGAGTEHCRKIAPPDLDVTLQVMQSKTSQLVCHWKVLTVLTYEHIFFCWEMCWRHICFQFTASSSLVPTYPYIVVPDVQSIFTGTHSGVGSGCGVVAGGLLYKHYGARIMFGSASGLVGLVSVFCMLASWRLTVNKEKS